MSVSTSTSGASTPRGVGSMTPPPNSSDVPSPLTVGTRFVKQYYKVLSTTPDQIVHFYRPSSVLSHGVGSGAATPVQSFESVGMGTSTATTTTTTSSVDLIKGRFFLEHREGFNNPIRFEFENGAIDAQLSVNGGILLSVTGHVVYLHADNNENDETETEHDSDLRRKAFVHTFFLGSMSAGSKRSYYVHNDILRFLNDNDNDDLEEEKIPSTLSPSIVAAAAANNKDAAVVDKKQGPASSSEVELPATIVEEIVKTPSASVTTERTSTLKAKTSSRVVQEAPGGGVEETKEPILEEEAENQPGNEGQASKDLKDAVKNKETRTKVTTAAASTDGAAAKKKGKGHVENHTPIDSAAAKTKTVSMPDNKEPEAKPASTKPTGSWASLVASGGGSVGGGGSVSGGGGGSTPATPTRGTPMRPSAKPSPSAAAATPPHTPSSSTSVTGADTTIRTRTESGTATATSSAGRPARTQHGKRDPDCTLVIKNVSGNAQESDIRHMFESFAEKSGAKVVGVTIPAHKNIAFVDYNSAAPVLAVVEQHEKEPFQLHGRVLDIYQKTVEQRARRGSGRGSYRGGGSGGGSGSGAVGGTSGIGGGASGAGNSGSSGGGGRQQFRRGGGRGDRDRDRDRGSSGRGGRSGGQR